MFVHNALISYSPNFMVLTQQDEYYGNTIDLEIGPTGTSSSTAKSNLSLIISNCLLLLIALKVSNTLIGL